MIMGKNTTITIRGIKLSVHFSIIGIHERTLEYSGRGGAGKL